ncbi:hypothetical protein F8388_018219 [Cannabis sativa]|uniref:Plastid lipid-associated protein/fibrillin conserved domain-containing protein n=1 Tax=Cannabis sativa TaxID=3483 RepID=A0A7J6GAX8_CANSA|nr:hypothetical protein F8388_018219 [Cannabis sativa]
MAFTRGCPVGWGKYRERPIKKGQLGALAFSDSREQAPAPTLAFSDSSEQAHALRSHPLETLVPSRLGAWPSVVSDREWKRDVSSTLTTFYKTQFGSGLKASSETRAKIVELIIQLEAQNLTPASTEALPLLNRKWILV